MKGKMNLLYFAFIIINIVGIGSFFIKMGIEGGVNLLLFISLNFSFFIVNACIKETISATISFILYVISWICIFIGIVAYTDLVGVGGGSEEFIYQYPIFNGFMFIVGVISLIISYTIVLIQMIRYFLKKQ